MNGFIKKKVGINFQHINFTYVGQDMKADKLMTIFPLDPKDGDEEKEITNQIIDQQYNTKYQVDLL